MGTHLWTTKKLNKLFSSHRGVIQILLIGIISSTLLSGCRALGTRFEASQLWSSPTLKDPESSQEHRGDIVASVNPGQVVGQSFVSRRSGLNGVELWLGLGADSEPTNGNLQVELYHTPQAEGPLLSLPVSFQTIADNATISIPIPPVNDRADHAYYLLFKTSDGTVHVMGREEDIYAGGELYINHLPQDADISFRTSYRYDLAAALSDLGSILCSIWLVLPLLLTLWLPGALILEFLLTGELDDWGTHTAISVGLSLAIIPVIMLWTSIAGFQWSQWSVYMASGLIAVLYLWRLWQRGALRWNPSKVQPTGLILGMIFLFSLFIRLAMVRDLATPAWVDSVHHGTLTRLILDLGGIPQSYMPYIDLQHANYHFGFHSALATFQWLSGLKLHTGMLVYGQVLNALSIFSAYLLTVTFTRNRSAGLVAALITGIFSPMPAYYASWGRYTQLAGLLILPAAVASVVQLWPQISHSEIQPAAHTRRWGWVLAGAIATAGLLLVHYRVAAFLAVLLFAHWITYNSRALWYRSLAKTIKPSTIWSLVIGGCGLILTLPWWPETISQFIVPFTEQSNTISTLPPFFAGFAWNLLTAASGRLVLYLAGLGLILAILLRRWLWPSIVLWVAGMFLLSNLSALGIPGLDLINTTSVQITLFLPLSLLIGFLFAWVLEGINSRLPTRFQNPYWAVVLLTGGILSLYGARALLPILNPITLLSCAPDEPAIVWLDKHIPEGESVLINPFLWGYGIYAGQDGGSWITPLAGRKTLPPPVLYGMVNQPEKARAIIDQTSQVLDLNRDPEALYEYLRLEGIHYVFLGARGGALSPQALRDSPLFQLLYAEDGAWIFKLL